MKKIFAYIPFILFLGVLLVPAIDRKLHILPRYQDTEKRDLAPRPIYSLHRPIPVMMHEFESYWNDNFGGRNLMLHLRALVWIRLLQTSPEKSVVIGQDGWLFYRSEAKNDGPGIDDYQGRAPMTDTELQHIKESVDDVYDKLSQKDIFLILVVAPNKSTIYNDKLPSAMQEQIGPTRLDQVKKVLSPDVTIIDPREVLRLGRSTMPTYLETDSHWNAFGAYLVAQEIIRNVPQRFGLTATDLSQEKVSVKKVQGEGDLASMMAARGIFDETDVYFESPSVRGARDYNIETRESLYSVHKWEQANATLPRISVFGDSFRTSLTPFLTPHFAQTCVIGYSTTFKINYDLMNLCRPQIVIWEIAERYLDRLDQSLYIKI